MKRAQDKAKRIAASLAALLLAAGFTAPTSAQKAIDLSDEHVENLVRLSYPYVALYNVNNKFALDDSSPMSLGGWNNIRANTTLVDHTLKSIARPNNDTLYLTAVVDVTQESVIMEFPSFDSKYVSLIVTAYDHHANEPALLERNLTAMRESRLRTLSDYLGEDAGEVAFAPWQTPPGLERDLDVRRHEAEFPPYGRTDFDA